MDEYLPRRFETGGEEHRLPHGGLLTKVVLACDLEPRPEFPEVRFVLGPAERGDIVRKRIEPHVHDVFPVARHRNPPRHL